MPPLLVAVVAAATMDVSSATTTNAGVVPMVLIDFLILRYDMHFACTLVCR